MNTKTLFWTVAIIGLLSVCANAQVTVSTAVNSGLVREPYNVVEDTNGNLFISDSVNDRIVRIDATTQAATVLAGVTGVSGSNDGAASGPNPAHFFDPQGLLVVNIGGTDGLLVADSGNNLIRFVRFSDGYVVTLAGQNLVNNGTANEIGINASFNIPVGMDQDTNGNVYIADEFQNVIRVMNLNDPVFGITNLVLTDGTIFHHPNAIAFVGTNQLWVADSYNNSVKLITLSTPTSGSLTAYLGSNSSHVSGTTDSAYGPSALFNNPCGLLWLKGVGLLISDTGNNSIRLATNNPAYGASNYAVSTYAGIPGTAGFVNNNALSATFNQPVGMCPDPINSAILVADLANNAIRSIQYGVPRPHVPSGLTATATYGKVTLTWTASLNATNYNVKRAPSSGGPYAIIGNSSTTSFTDTKVINGATYFYVVSALNAGGESANSAEVSATPPLPPVPDPQIGYVDFPATTYPLYTSVFHPEASFIFNNDAPIIMVGAAGSQTYYTYGPTTTNGIPDPTTNSASAPSGYQDGLSQSEVANFAVAQIMPDLTIKAMGAKSDGSPNSAIVQARFQFITANPNIMGDNAAGFTISDLTANAHLYYTLDGSDPSSTNAGGFDLGVLSGTNTFWTVSFPISTDTWFKVRAFRANYQPSAIVSNLFTATAFHPTTITFGRPTGEPHSSFIARPGQFYYAPVTLQLSPNFGKMYSLQFNAAVTNGITNIFTGNSIQPIVNGAGIDFFPMLMTKVQPNEGQYFPPADGSWYLPIPAWVPYTTSGVTNLTSSTFVNTNNNLLGIGWLYRTGIKYTATDTNGFITLDFDTAKQDLIAYSIAHDTLFTEANGLVVVGAYSFQIPSNTVSGDQYFIQLGSPSATSDGVGAPGASIYIQPPAQSQAVTIGSPAYLVGDAAPFHWLNAGDFGDTNLDNSDVMQVYQAGILGVNMPPRNSDLYAAMDSCGGFGSFDVANGYYTNSGSISASQQQAMWDGNDLTINTSAFGDTNLDINDLYVTFRRSLDPSLTWFKRYWTNGMFVAVTNINYAFNSNTPHLLLSKSSPLAKTATDSTPNYLNSSLVFSAGDAIAAAGNTIQIPINVNFLGSYPLRVLGLNLTVHSLDGSPDITTPATFTPSAALGTPAIASSKNAANFSAAWLNSGIAGLSSNATIGTLTVTLPAGATSDSAYAVHFDFASGSPNGLAVFPNQKLTGLITTTARTNSSYGDGIPDSWRLRWFGTVNNLLSTSNACPSGDGVPNWEKFVAGVDPNVANDFPSVNPKAAVPAGATTAIHWPSVSGKNYAIERSTSLFNGPWTILSTNTGTGGDMEFDDTNSASVKFYRVRIVP